MAHKQTTRSNANTQNIQVSENPKSGFDLSHKTKDSLRLGIRELIGYEYVMSGDKFRTSTAHNLQFAPTLGTSVPSMDIRIEKTFVPFRSVNSDYEDTLSFDKGNAWVTSQYPHVELSALVLHFMNALELNLTRSEWNNMQPTNFYQVVDRLRDHLRPYFIDDLCDSLHLTISQATSVISAETRARALYEILRLWFGLGSYLDKLNCPILPNFVEFYKLLTAWSTSTSSARLGDYMEDRIMSWAENMPIAVMPLRALYADWYETTRDANLEPARQLPRYKKLSNSTEGLEQIIFCYLTPRYALFDKDIWTTAQVDSPYREIIAPIVNSDGDITFSTLTSPSSEDSLTQDVVNLNRMSHVLTNNGLFENSAIAETDAISALGLDLVALKRAKMARAWLMRGHVFGDEYADHILAQYGVKLSDSRINVPELLNVTSQEINVNSQTNPTATAEMPAGARSVTMDSNASYDSTDFFVEENGIVFTWAYVVPSVTYEPYESRNLIMFGKDFPQPVLANDSEEYSFSPELSRKLAGLTPFGRHMKYHAWRSRVNENHGEYSEADLVGETFIRNFTETPRLNAAFIHCHVQPEFMVKNDQLQRFCYGTFTHNFFVERELPIVNEVC